ncbi:MAG: Ig-like domain-containing protein [Bacteroidota bacterium]|nr:Ig-like domain-containing protein [Bacteroidota bacterium]
MKNSILFILLFCITCGFTKIQAQPKCVFDTLYPNFGYYGFVGENVIQLKDGGYAIRGFTSKFNTMFYPDEAFSTVLKIDRCGNKIWQYDDTAIFFSYSTTGLNLIEEEDNGITFLNDTLDLIKLDKNGNRKWVIKIDKDTVRYNSIIKVASNHYLLAGTKKVAPNKGHASILIIDSLGNTISQKNYFVNSGNSSYLTSLYRKSLNELILLGFEDSALMVISTDLSGNINNIYKKYIHDSLIDQYKIRKACLNSDLDEILYSTSSALMEKNKLYLARLNLNSVIISDTIISATNNDIADFLVSPGPNKSLVFLTRNNSYFINHIDSNFTLIKRERISNIWGFGYEFQANQFLYSSDGSLLTIGYTTIYGGSFSAHFNLYAKKIYLYKYVESLLITGPGSIDTKNGQIQLTAVITPIDAPNQQIFWAVNDTSKAVITQTGLLTAKSNGTVTVTATSMDNSLATVSKNIYITNQSIGMGEQLTHLQISVYPNPANQSINISFQSIVTNPEFELFDAKVMHIKNARIDKINEQLYKLDLINLTEGIYILSIGVNEMKQYQKVMVLK